MWVVIWDDGYFEVYEEHFEDTNELFEFIEYLENEGIYNARICQKD